MINVVKVFLLASFFLLFTSGAKAAAKRALLIASYHASFPTYEKRLQGLRDALDPAGVLLDVEYMDSKRLYTDTDLESFHELLRHKLTRLPRYDAIIAADDNAFNYVMDHRETLFQDLPVIFFGVNDSHGALERIKDDPEVTGVFEHISVDKTLELIRRLLPRVKTVCCIVDGTPSGQADLKAVLAHRSLTGLNLEVLDLQGMTWEGFGRELSSLDDSTVLLLLSAYRDVKGRQRLFSSVLSFITHHARVPVFHLWEHGIGQGAIGGHVVSNYNQGFSAGEQAVLALSGVSPSKIPIVREEEVNLTILDQKELEHYDVTVPENLAADAMLVNSRQSFYAKYKTVIDTTAPVLLLLVVGIVYLVRFNGILQRARDKLRKSEKKYRTSIDSAPDAVIMTDPDGIILEANFAAYSMTRQTSLEGVSLLELIPDDEWHTVRDALNQLAADGVFRCEGRPLSLVESSRFIYVDAVRFEEAINLWFCKDVTETIHAQEALEESENRFRSLVDQAADLILVLRPDGDIAMVNRSACTILGYDSSELLSRTVMDIVPGLDLNEQMDIWSGFPAPFEKTMRRRNGTTFPAEIHIADISYGGRHMLLAIARDITKRKHNERILMRESAINQAQASIAHELGRPGMDMIQASTIILEYSLTATESAAGYVGTIDPESGSLVVHTFRDLLKSGSCSITDHPAIFAKQGSLYPGLWGVSLNERQPFLVNDVQAHPDFNGIPEGHFPLHSLLSVPVIHDGQLVGQIAVANASREYDQSDVDALLLFAHLLALSIQRRRMDEALRLAKEQAEEASRAKSEFLANMSHEIRTPLNGMFGMLQLALDGDMTTEERHYLETAMESGKNLLGVINDVLDFSKIEAGKIDLLEEDFSLRTTIASVMEIFHVGAGERGLDLTWYIAPEVPEIVCGDGGRVRQILFNLVGNAIKFTEFGGVNVACHPLPATREREVRILLAVDDTGVGIPADKLEDIFEAFEQVDGSHTRRYQGSGLGLAIVRRFARLMGGDALLESDEGVGSTAMVCLALEEARCAGAVCFDEPLKTVTRPLRILLVEDERVNRMAARTLLQKQGHVVVEAETGRQALQIMGYERFEVVLMDIQMPEMDGIETAKRIRAGEAGENGDVPIIALTAHALKGDRETFLEAGMNGYIAKPMQLGELMAELARVLPLPQPNREVDG